MRSTARSVRHTETLARAFVERLKRGEEATVVGLSGELGAGKTAFVKGVAKALGVKDVVTSPTFVIERIYSVKHSAFTHLVHIDAYRLDSPRELAALGFRELLADPKNLVVVEWAEKVGTLLPKRTHWVTMFHVSPSVRKIHITHAKSRR